MEGHHRCGSYGGRVMSRRARARQPHEDARWVALLPEPDDEQQTGDASDGCGDGDEDEQEQ